MVSTNPGLGHSSIYSPESSGRFQAQQLPSGLSVSQFAAIPSIVTMEKADLVVIGAGQSLQI